MIDAKAVAMVALLLVAIFGAVMAWRSWRNSREK